MKSRAVILGAARTPFGRLGGALASLSATALGAAAIRAGLERAGLDPSEVEHVILGQVLQAGVGQAPARQAIFQAGLAKTVTGETVNKVCASGLLAVAQASRLVSDGDRAVVVAGGMESMSNTPYLLPGARAGYRFGAGVLVDGLVHDGLLDASLEITMAAAAAKVAAELGPTREEQDAFALRSHERATAAGQDGRLAREIVSLWVTENRSIAFDEPVRADASLAALAALRALDPGGTVTAGNAPGVNDGAAALVIASEEWARERGLSSLAQVVDHAWVAWDSPYLALTPAMAAQLLLDLHGLRTSDIAVWEINEAFAAVALTSAQRLGIDAEAINLLGGAIAFGHPLGASGARIVGSVAHQLRARGGGFGIAAICSGGGQGDALLLRAG
jgi:acetyl-CoA C-acetyltransferase